MTTTKKFSALLAASLFLCATASHAAGAEAKHTPFNGTDISGVYTCVGHDVHDGDFKSTMTVTLDAPYSSGKHGSFKATLKGEHDAYTGSIVSNGKQLAMDFANTDVSKKDFGVALATVTAGAKGKFKIEKVYYESQYMGGSNGVETCTLQ